MKRNNTYKMNSVCGEKFIMAEGIENIDVNNLIAMNETAAFLWDAMGDEEFTVEGLVEKITAEYEVSADEAKTNLEDFITLMKEQGCILD